MSFYRHGVTVTELPTSLTPPVTSTAGLPVVIGTAPLNLASDAAPVNQPVLVNSFAEAVAAFGFNEDFATYTLCEFMSSHFKLFASSPAVLINVLDPNVHKVSVTGESLQLIGGEKTIEVSGLLKDSLLVSLEEFGSSLLEGQDYKLTWTSEGFLKIERFKTGAIESDNANLILNYLKLNPTQVQVSDIVSAIDTVEQVFPRFRLVPGLLLAPSWSANPEVAAPLAAKAENINGMFKAMALIDIPVTGMSAVTKHTEVAAYKNNSVPQSAHVVACWPKVRLGTQEYFLSTQVAGVIARTDAKNSGIPFVSPSNNSLQNDSAITGTESSAKEVTLGPDLAAYLNGNGIVSALNFVGGWVLWGNRTSVYPASSDPIDAFIAVRRMMNWINNNLILSFWQKVDDPMNRNLIESVVDSANIWLNGLAARGAILGGRCEFRPEENPITSLMDGIIRVHLYVTPPSPAREIEFMVEYDPQYLATLAGE